MSSRNAHVADSSDEGRATVTVHAKDSVARSGARFAAGVHDVSFSGIEKHYSDTGGIPGSFSMAVGLPVMVTGRQACERPAEGIGAVGP